MSRGNAAQDITDEQLAGLDSSHLVPVATGQWLHPLAAAAFAQLQRDAAAAGFDLAIASSYRTLARQVQIWNGKLRGERPVHDDQGTPLDLAQMPDKEKLAAVLRFSALPGTSRHHWGTDLDVFDAAALPAHQSARLVPSEVCPGGLFDPLHRWLDQRMATHASYGFFRPYARDRGGVAPERWHLSYAPLARHLEIRITPVLLHRAWAGVDIACRDLVETDLPGLLSRYVSVPADWAGASPGSDPALGSGPTRD